MARPLFLMALLALLIAPGARAAASPASRQDQLLSMFGFPPLSELEALGFPMEKNAPGTDTPAHFQASAAAIPGRLQQLGYQNFGADFNLKGFEGSLGDVKVIFGVVHGTKERDCRASAYWQTHPEKMIHVDRAAWVTMGDVQEVLALHEYLGVEGYNDDLLWISIPLWLLANPKATKYLTHDQVSQIEHWVTEKAAFVPDNLVALGGVTGVGGGGEGSTVRAKMVPIMLAIAKLASPKSQAADKAEAWDDISTTITSEREAYRDLNCLMH